MFASINGDFGKRRAGYKVRILGYEECSPVSTEGAQQQSPGQSAAPPWVVWQANIKALKGRNITRRQVCCALSGLFALAISRPRTALCSALGFIVCAPSVLRGKNSAVP